MYLSTEIVDLVAGRGLAFLLLVGDAVHQPGSMVAVMVPSSAMPPTTSATAMHLPVNDTGSGRHIRLW